MEKFLVTLEFRYTEVYNGDEHYTRKKITIAIEDDFEEASKKGNAMLEILESKYPLHKFPQGHFASRDRFSKNGSAFGGRKMLITDSAYLKTPFQFFAKITPLKFDDVAETIDEVDKAVKYFREWDKLQDEDE